MKTKTLLVLAVSLNFASVYAQSEEQVLNSDPINVDGYLAEDKPVSDGELSQIRGELRRQKMESQLNKEKSKDLGKLTQQTEKLLETRDEYVDTKIESTHAINEFNEKFKESEKKLKCIMEQSDSEECEPYKNKYGKNKQEVEKVEPVKVEQPIQLTQAAPVVSTAEVAPADTGAPFEKIKLLPYVGGTSYNGEIESLEAEIATGLRLESNINSRFSMGIGFNYGQLKTNDFANNNPWMDQSYYGVYGVQGREIQFKTMGVDLYGKFFITNGERFRPYVGVGLGYNRANLKYAENNQFVMPTYGSFGNEDYRTSYAVGNLSAGSEIMINRTIGLNLEAAYSTGLSNSLSSKNGQNPYSSPDQRRLQQLGDEIINANALSIFAGMVIVF